MLFCLMLIVEGMGSLDFFRYVGDRLLQKTGQGGVLP